MIRTIGNIGDSLSEGTYLGFSYSQGGTAKGSWWELARDRLANVVGIGPLLSTGFRSTLVVTGEWSFSGSWSVTTSTDAFYVTPYGLGKYANGIGSVSTYTLPKGIPPVVGIKIYMVDYTGGGNWQYRIDGGTWTNHGQTLANNNRIIQFYLNTPISSTIEFRAYNGTADCGCFVAGVEPAFVNLATATDGLIWHNFGANGMRLHYNTVAGSGDPMNLFDTITNGTGSPNSPYVNTGWMSMFINDVFPYNDTAQWAADMATVRNRLVAQAPVAFMSAWEVVLTINSTWQANYRAQTKTTAAGFSPASSVFDFYDTYAANGWIGNAAVVAAGFLNPLDNTHEIQAGHLDIAPRMYWFVRNLFFSSYAGKPSATPVAAKAPATAYAGKRPTVVFSAGGPISVAA